VNNKDNNINNLTQIAVSPNPLVHVDVKPALSIQVGAFDPSGLQSPWSFSSSFQPTAARQSRPVAGTAARRPREA
jgi:hypothetical protein